MKIVKALLSAFVLMAATVAQAEPYTQEAFDRLLSEGKSTLVAVHADWCPTCKRQAPIIDTLLKQPSYRAITLLKVDFDKQKDVVKSLRVPRQSALIVYKNGKEVGRSLGDTSRVGIENLLKRAI
jgi:thioredoxin 1